ncbi:MAG: CRISPR system precrRNA processing endoribonuclease RAMP protein Cas6 [Deltaproteobacteria bacterium]|jgi:hypothetical protein|nr:CRISPR system precrRNA processing endoribonuclease RAMP protein Cas6 [Deltaproteobacteria bacterium]
MPHTFGTVGAAIRKISSHERRLTMPAEHRQPVWPIARYRFIFEAQSAIHLPEYAGSMLRGAFGHALRRIACMTRELRCPGCPLYASCPYSLIFEPPPPLAHALQRFSAVPAPYVVEPPVWGEYAYPPGTNLIFSVTLFGQALEKLALIVFAWQRAFEHGIGGGAAKLKDVRFIAPQGEMSVFDAKANRISAHEQLLKLPPLAGENFCLTFTSPLRLQENGRALPPEGITARALLLALARRVSLLAEFHAGFTPGYDFREMNKLAAAIALSCDLRWRHWERWSNRQKQKMTLNGLTGVVRLYDVPTLFHETLQVGQWTHVGKNAAFGLGRYILEPIGR